MSTAEVRRKMTAMERKASQGGFGTESWEGGAPLSGGTTVILGFGDSQVMAHMIEACIN